MTSILIADDDPNIRRLVVLIMKEHGYDTLEARNGREAVDIFVQERPGLVILDVMMPQVDGFQACALIREADPTVPVLFLSAKGDVVDRKTGLRAGADDYLAKPFDEEELALRVEALLRRASASSARSIDEVLETGPFIFDQKRLLLLKHGREIFLTPKEFQILNLLASHQGQTFPASELVSLLWGDAYAELADSVPVYIRRIRSKIEDDPSRPHHLLTIRGCGYYFEP